MEPAEVAAHSKRMATVIEKHEKMIQDYVTATNNMRKEIQKLNRNISPRKAKSSPRKTPSYNKQIKNKHSTMAMSPHVRKNPWFRFVSQHKGPGLSLQQLSRKYKNRSHSPAARRSVAAKRRSVRNFFPKRKH